MPAELYLTFPGFFFGVLYELFECFPGGVAFYEKRSMLWRRIRKNRVKLFSGLKGTFCIMGVIIMGSLGEHANVYPSGLAVVVTDKAIVPPPPALLSTTIDCFR